MPRPQRNNCEYFPHFTTMRNHRKVKALRNKFGPVLGYAFWAIFLEYLTELDGNEFEFSPIECEMFAAELGVSAAEIPPMINYCTEIGLLFRTDTNFIYSESLNEELKPVYDKRGREREKSKSRKRHENGVFANENTMTQGVSAAEIPQRRVKKSKEEKNNISAAFDQFRIKYPGTKGGLETELDNFLKKYSDDIIPLLLPALEREIKYHDDLHNAGQFEPSWKNLKTWINNKCWEQEFPKVDRENITTNKANPSEVDQAGTKEFDFASLNAQRLSAIQSKSIKSTQ